MTDVVLICSTMPAREPQFIRSLTTWWNEAHKFVGSEHKNLKICVWFEGYKDPSYLLDNFKTLDPRVKLIYAGQEALSGSHVRGYNHWFNEVEGDVYIFTHPDLLFPHRTIHTAYDMTYLHNVYATFKCFWMSPDMTRDIEQFSWRSPETLEQEPMLFELDQLLKGSFYANRTVRDIKAWESSTTHVLNRRTAQKIYPLPELGHQGYDDPYQLGLRGVLGIPTQTIMEPILVHQYHDNSWHGTGEQAVQEASSLIEVYKKERLK